MIARMLAPVALLSLAVASQDGLAEVVRVADGETIQHAIDRAQPGDTVEIPPGEYAESITIHNTSLTIRRGRDKGVTHQADDHGKVILRPAEEGGCVIDILNTGDEEVRLSGVTITGGTGKKEVMRAGGGVHVVGGMATFAGCIFEQNSAELGGALAASNAVVTLGSCIFRDNSASDQGGALHLADATLTVSSCRFEENTAPIGGAIYINASTVELGGGFTRNRATSGGAIHARSATLTAGGPFFSLAFLGNTAVEGGAIELVDSSATLSGVQFIGNTAQFGGGAIRAEKSAVELSQPCLFVSNQAEKGSCLAAELGSTATLDHCGFESNSPPETRSDEDSTTDVVERGDSGDFRRPPSPGPDGEWGTADDFYGEWAC